MELNANADLSKSTANATSAGPGLPPLPPPVIAAPPALPVALTPPASSSIAKPSALRMLLPPLLSLCLGLFLADGLISFLDDSLILISGIHALTTLRGIVFTFSILMAIFIYVLMAFTPMIPKRIFLPVTLFNPIAGLVFIPFLIYFYGHKEQVAWAISLCQVAFGLAMFWWLRGRFGLRWPLISEEQLGTRRFSWGNTALFLAANVFAIIPATIIYLFLCASLAAGHFSDGFVALRPSGLMVQARKYVRNDGKTIQLVPMAHVGEGSFYHEITQSFGSNSVVLMEGVTDRNNLLTNRITYKRMAASLGLAEQQKEFKPSGGDWVRADVDVDQFSSETIAFLNLVMRMYLKGINVETLLPLFQYTPAPGFETRLFEDLLRKRNHHLLEELNARLVEAPNIVVPWGAAHMPEIAEAIQKSGFRLQEAHDYHVIRFFQTGKKISNVE